jgi:homoserine kinase
VQQEQFMESMPYGNPFETKDLVAMQKTCGNAHADNVAPALWVDLR